MDNIDKLSKYLDTISSMTRNLITISAVGLSLYWYCILRPVEMGFFKYVSILVLIFSILYGILSIYISHKFKYDIFHENHYVIFLINLIRFVYISALIIIVLLIAYQEIKKK